MEYIFTEYFERWKESGGFDHMNYIWGGMLLTGIAYGILTGETEAVSEAVLSSAREGVSLCVALFGVMALWSGLMEIAKDAGLIQMISRRIRPIMHFLFPRIPEGHPALEYITTNCVANVFGLGSASTVYGLKAMEALEELEEERREEEEQEKSREKENICDAAGAKGLSIQQKKRNGISMRSMSMPRGTASNEMCTFLIINISSLQLFSINIIAYRSQYGSVNPTAIVGPGIVATAVSTGVAVVFCKVMERK